MGNGCCKPPRSILFSGESCGGGGVPTLELHPDFVLELRFATCPCPYLPTILTFSARLHRRLLTQKIGYSVDGHPVQVSFVVAIPYVAYSLQFCRSVAPCPTLIAPFQLAPLELRHRVVLVAWSTLEYGNTEDLGIDGPADASRTIGEGAVWESSLYSRTGWQHSFHLLRRIPYSCRSDRDGPLIIYYRNRTRCRTFIRGLSCNTTGSPLVAGGDCG